MIWRGTFKPDRSRRSDYHHVIPFIGIFACVLAAGTSWSAWRTGAKRVLNASGAQELIAPATPELQRLDNVVEEMAIASGVPKPKIWIVPDGDPNAFATGQDPFHRPYRGDPGPARGAGPR